MPLSDDQRAMLRLLAQREQGYDDLAALMGLSVEEVRAKVVEALAQLEADGEPTPTLPSERAAAAEAEIAESKPEPSAEAPAPEPPATPEEPVAEPPAASEPAPAGAPAPAAAVPAPAKPTPPAPAAKRTPPPRPKLSLPGSGGARAAIAAGAAVLVLLVVILVVGGGDDSGESEGDSGANTTVEEGANTNAADNPDITQAVLQATDGSDAEGVASFGRVKNSLALQIEASGLEPTGKGESYTVWLAQSPQKMLPLATTAVGEDGKIGAQTEVPTEVLGYLANETFTKIVVTQTENAALQASLKKATTAKQAPDYTGTEVLNGTVTGPIVGAANREKEAE